MSAKWMKYKDCELLYVDYRLLSPRRIIELTYEVAAIVEQRGSFPSIINLENVPITENIFSATQHLTTDVFAKQTSKCAILGNTGLRKVMIAKYMEFMSENFQVFDCEKEAFEFVASSKELV